MGTMVLVGVLVISFSLSGSFYSWEKKDKVCLV
jgi:hypothetical protein